MAVSTIAVIGSGTMGSGIAQVFAHAGYSVLLHDVARAAAVDQREDGRVAHVAAVPIGLAADLDGLEHEGQAARGKSPGGKFGVGYAISSGDFCAAPGLSGTSGSATGRRRAL